MTPSPFGPGNPQAAADRQKRQAAAHRRNEQRRQDAEQQTAESGQDTRDQ